MNGKVTKYIRSDWRIGLFRKYFWSICDHNDYFRYEIELKTMLKIVMFVSNFKTFNSIAVLCLMLSDLISGART